jgi:hypothetical protein
MERRLTRRRAVRPQLKRDPLGRVEPRQHRTDVLERMSRQHGCAGAPRDSNVRRIVNDLPNKRLKPSGAARSGPAHRGQAVEQQWNVG